VIELLEPLRGSWRELARTNADIRIDESDIVAVAAIVGEAAA
jgi:hypothetical protein